MAGEGSKDLQEFIDRIRRLEAEKGVLAEQILEAEKGVLAEQIRKALLIVIRRRKMERREREQSDSMIEWLLDGEGQ